MKQLILAIVFLSLASIASAQTGALVSATLTTAGTATQSSVIALPAGATCGQPPFPGLPGTPTNPTRVIWTDPAAPTLICVADRTAFIAALPVGNYTATMIFTDDLGRTSPASAVSNPFLRAAPLPPPPSAPMGVQVR